MLLRCRRAELADPSGPPAPDSAPPGQADPGAAAPGSAALGRRLAAIRDAHEGCDESARQCRARIIWATNGATRAADPATVRSLLPEHASAVNELLFRNAEGHIAHVFVAGRRLQVAAA
ncbi:MAG: hypothetical protein QOG52_904, partial [Frankiaceae bacterium]|nr:hypothetical protein [Frankiaceae bacterium]